MSNSQWQIDQAHGERVQREWDRLAQTVGRRVKQVHAQREAILEAFMAETGCMPSECEQVQVTEGTTVRWFVRRRKPARTPENDTAVAAIRPFWEADE